MNRKVLLTGATGLVGTALTRALAGTSEIHAVVRRPETAPAGTRPVPVDLATDWSTDTLPKSLDAVVHLAQAENYREFPAAAESIYRVNTASTMKLLDHARAAGAKTFVLASTGGIYGSADRAFREEDTPAVDVAPGAGGSEPPELGFYLRTRRASEILASAFQPHFQVVVMRFFFVYGPGQKNTMLVPRLISSVREGRPITLSRPDGLKLNPVHVDDAVRAVAAALDLGRSETVNVAGPVVLTLRQVGDAIGAAVGRAPVYAVDDSAPRHMIGDVSRMTRAFGAPAIAFADGVRSAV